ncbi:unnamed protein product [Rotaria sp. Silwood2]|nr:unnamed protein product [Rotaria sp. Silwood2]
MGKQDYYRQQSYNDILYSEYQNDNDDHLIEFQILLFEELLCNIRKVPFADYINNCLLNDGAKFYHCIRKGWYQYIGKELPKTIENYLNVTTIMNEQISHQTKIFVNNEYERLDIEFYFRHDYPKRLTITFEPGYPAVA